MHLRLHRLQLRLLIWREDLIRLRKNARAGDDFVSLDGGHIGCPGANDALVEHTRCYRGFQRVMCRHGSLANCLLFVAMGVDDLFHTIPLIAAQIESIQHHRPESAWTHWPARPTPSPATEWSSRTAEPTASGALTCRRTVILARCVRAAGQRHRNGCHAETEYDAFDCSAHVVLPNRPRDDRPRSVLLDCWPVTTLCDGGEKTMTTRPVRVLVVEDEANIRELVCLHLRHEGYVCEGVGDGKAALERTQTEPYDLMVLDVMLPGLDGLSLCRAIRNGEINRDVPILMLTARREESDKVVGLESGADDYLTKPFGVRELVARARALLRRPRQAAAASTAAGSESAVIHVQGIEIDVAKRRVRLNGRDIELTDQEFRLLQLLATHVGIVFSREALLAKIWRGDTFVTVRSVDTLVKRLRRRIEADPASPQFLLTVWGVGYKFAEV